MTPVTISRASRVTVRKPRAGKWRTEYIPADDPFARFAAMAQRVLLRRMIAANRAHWRKYDEHLARKRESRERAAQLHQSAP